MIRVLSGKGLKSSKRTQRIWKGSQRAVQFFRVHRRIGARRSNSRR